MGGYGHCQNCPKRGQGEEQGRNSLSSLNSDPPIFLTSLITQPPQDPEGNGAHHMTTFSDQEDVRESLLWVLLEKFGFFDKWGQAWMADSLILPFPPCSNEDMMARGQQFSCNHEATGIFESFYFHLIQVLHDIIYSFLL